MINCVLNPTGVSELADFCLGIYACIPQHVTKDKDVVDKLVSCRTCRTGTHNFAMSTSSATWPSK
jgi:hypothetical protein